MTKLMKLKCSSVFILFYFLLINISFGFDSNNENFLNVATWNVRQSTADKLQKTILVKDQDTQIVNFIGQWVKERNIDVLAMQEIYEKHKSGVLESISPIDLVLNQLPDSFEVIRGTSIRASIFRGFNSEWKEFCPIFYNSEKVTCSASDEQMLPIGLDLIGPKVPGEVQLTAPRYMQWAYCKSVDKKFDFVMTCLHANFKTADAHVIGSVDALSGLFEEKVVWPPLMRQQNLDFILAGDFNLDRRTSTVFDNIEFIDHFMNVDLPKFMPNSRWNRKAFTKLKDIYTFTEAKKRSNAIYDDVINSHYMTESLVSKTVDSLIDDYFIKQKTDRVDMTSLLGLSDHLPVISTFDMSLDND